MRVKDYDVLFSDKQGRWTCTCPDFKFRKKNVRPNSDLESFTCKHIRSVLADVQTQVTDTRYKARVVFEPVADILRQMGKEFERFEIAGSYRRQKPFIKDLDVVVYTRNVPLLRELIETVGEIKYGGDSRITSEINNVQVDFRIVSNLQHWATMLCHFTGSKEENIRLRRKAQTMGMKLNEYALTLSDGTWASTWKEEDVYSQLMEPYKAPQER